MIDPPHGSPQPREPRSGSEDFRTLASLRQAHQALRQAATDPSQIADSNLGKAIRDFLAEARKTGACLNGGKERRAAQAILDFWNAELLTLPKAVASDFTPSLLDPFDPTRSADAPGPQAQAQAPARGDQAGLIRFTAFARQWRSAGKTKGYLLSGLAISEAKQFRGIDPDLDAFVQESEAAEQAAHVRRRSFLRGACLAAVLVAACGISGFLWVKYTWLPNTLRSNIDIINSNGADKIEAIAFLDRWQDWLAPYQLSSTLNVLNHVAFTTSIKLNAPNWSQKRFVDISLPNSQMIGASFDQSRFSFFDGGPENHFEGAILHQAQFRSARVAFTSFKGAQLYRAVFDRAALCHADFSGADLRQASFWGTTIDPETESSITRTAWWLATGWSWDKIKDLEAANAVPQDLKESPGFKQDIERGTNSFEAAESGSKRQALALNDIAWSRAIWRIDLVKKTGKMDINGPVPTTALEAADQAIAIASRLQPKEDVRNLVKTLLDTKAYILMEADEINSALETFKSMQIKSSETMPADSLFRYAIARYAADQDKADAIKDLETALNEKRYQPTHELYTLRKYTIDQPDIAAVIQKSINSFWPSPPPEKCPAKLKK